MLIILLLPLTTHFENSLDKIAGAFKFAFR